MKNQTADDSKIHGVEANACDKTRQARFTREDAHELNKQMLPVFLA